MNGCLVTDFVGFFFIDKTNNGKSTRLLPYIFVTDKDQTFAFSIKIVPEKVNNERQN